MAKYNEFATELLKHLDPIKITIGKRKQFELREGKKMHEKYLKAQKKATKNAKIPNNIYSR
jgi:hypothetical protein